MKWTNFQGKMVIHSKRLKSGARDLPTTYVLPIVSLCIYVIKLTDAIVYK